MSLFAFYCIVHSIVYWDTSPLPFGNFSHQLIPGKRKWEKCATTCGYICDNEIVLNDVVNRKIYIAEQQCFSV